MKARGFFWIAALAILAVGAVPAETLGWNNLGRIIGTQTTLIRQKATKEQIHVAQTRATVYYSKLPPTKKTVLQKNKVRYIAVDTVRSKTTSPKAKKTVMIWDTQAAALASNDVYDLETPPVIGQTAKFDTYAAEYVGAGG